MNRRLVTVTAEKEDEASFLGSRENEPRPPRPLFLSLIFENAPDSRLLFELSIRVL
jgi:hypothetical protein